MRKRTIAAVAAVVVAAAVAIAACSAPLAQEAPREGPAAAEGPAVLSDPEAEEAPAADAEAETEALAGDAPEAQLPAVPDSWVSGPEEFDSEEDRERFEAGEWHTDKELQGRYGFKEIRTDNGATYAAGELLLSVPLGTSDGDVDGLAASLGGFVAEISDFPTLEKRRATVVFEDGADIEALAAEAMGMEGVISAEPNYSGSAADGEELSGVTVDPYRPGQVYLAQSAFGRQVLTTTDPSSTFGQKRLYADSYNVVDPGASEVTYAIAGVEESGQFVGGPGNWYNWAQPKYYLCASLYCRRP